jgi:hypothetical protein
VVLTAASSSNLDITIAAIVFLKNYVDYSDILRVLHNIDIENVKKFKRYKYNLLSFCR